MTTSAETERKRSDQVQGARTHARDLRDKVSSGAAELIDAVAWLAAEVRCGRIEHHDRIAREMEGREPLPRARRDRPADSP